MINSKSPAVCGQEAVVSVPDNLAQIDLFANLTPDQLNQVYSICKEVTHYQGELILAENEPGREFFIILKGKIEIQVDPAMVSKDAARYEPVTISVLREGQSFGEIALVDQGVRSASARCSTRTCKLLALNRDDFMDLLRKNPEIGFIVMYNLAEELCFKIRQTNLNLREALLSTTRLRK
jgi:CRP-like cAMP-binding protein